MSHDNRYLQDNFAPVLEETTCERPRVSGALPRELSGRLLRIGPNPLAPDPASHHWFLGNGLVHGVRIAEGEALWYRSRLVRDDEVTHPPRSILVFVAGRRKHAAAGQIIVPRAPVRDHAADAIDAGGATQRGHQHRSREYLARQL